MKKYVSDWGSNESEWMESAKLFMDACTEVHSQSEVLKQYSTSVLNRAVTDARWGSERGDSSTRTQTLVGRLSPGSVQQHQRRLGGDSANSEASGGADHSMHRR